MATSLNASLNVKLNAASLNASTKQVRQALGRITGQASEFQKSLDASTARVFAFGATTAVLNGVSQAFRKLVATTVEVQKRLVEINSIFKATESAFNRFRTAIFRVAQETGQSFSTVAEGAAELARQGLSAAETANRLKAALVLTRISGMDAEKSVKALTAAINGFTSAGLTANQIVNKMVAVDTAFAVSTQDLAEAFSRAGSTAEDAGVSFNELLGLITAVEQRTARGGAVIGNAFKSIFTRLSRGSTIDSLKELGVSIDATQSGIQKLQALSSALDKISDPTVASKIKELAGGVFQINVVSAALKDLGSDTSVFKNAALVAASATNEAFEKNVVLNKTISAQMNSLVQGLTSLAERIGSITFGPLLEGLLGIAGKFTTFLDKALDPERGNVFIKGFFKAIGRFLGGPAVIMFTAAVVKITKLIAKFAIEGLRSLFQIGTQTEKIKQIEGGIVQLLGSDAALRKVILSATSTQAQKEQAVITAIQRENALLTQQAALMRSLASAAAARGVTGFGTSGFKGRRGRSFAGGFQQEEAMATMLGAKNPKAQRSEGTIGGRHFTKNNKELEIKNFGRNGDSAVIPMTYAGGFVPNYAPKVRVPREMGERSLRGQSKTNLEKIANNSKHPNSKEAKALLAAKAKKTKEVIVVNPAKTAMLIPTIGMTSKIEPFSSGQFEQGKKRYNYEYKSGLQVYGPKVPKAVDQAADPEDERLKRSITKGVTTSAANFAKLLHPVLGEPKPHQIRTMLEKQGGGKGALRGLIGAAFEAAVNVALGISPAKNVEGGDFDVKSKDMGGNMSKTGLNRVIKLFGIKSKKTALMDFKVNALKGSEASFAKKLFNQKRYKIEQRKIKGASKGRARGFIPNFAGGLTASIERERAAGIPVSNIRAHFDKGGRPKAVTNTRDEPNGLASLGFIPNFAGNFAKGKGEGGGMGGGQGMFALMAVQGVFSTLAAKLEQNVAVTTAEIEKRNESIDILKVGIIQSIKERKINNDILEQKKIERPALQKFIEGLNTATSALMIMATVNMFTGGGVGKVGASMIGMGKVAKLKRVKDAAKHATYLKGGGGGMKRAAADRVARKALQRTTMKAVGSRLGVVGALGVGAYDMGKTYFDKSLNKEEKTERMGRTGSSMGGAAVGAAIGTAILPVVGTIIGGVIGYFGGDAIGKGVFGTGATERKDKRMVKAQEVATKESYLGWSEEDFNKRATEVLSKMKAEGKDYNSVYLAWEKATQERAEEIAKPIEGGHGGGGVSKEQADRWRATKDKLDAATRALIDVRFNEKFAYDRNLSEINTAHHLQSKATEQLTKAKEALAAVLNKHTEEAKRQQDKAGLQVSMKSAISGPYAGAVGIASEEQLMQTQIGSARVKLHDATIKRDLGKGDATELNDAVTKAAAFFKGAIEKAGITFKNNIRRSEALIFENRKRIEAIKKSEFKTTEEAINSLRKGETGGDLASMGAQVKGFEVRAKEIREKEFREREGSDPYKPDYEGMPEEDLNELTRGLAKYLERYQAEVGRGDPMAYLKTIAPEYHQLLEGTQEARKQTKFTYSEDPALQEAQREAIKGVDVSGGQNQQEARDKLTDANKALQASIENSKKNWDSLFEGLDTKAVALEIQGILTAMETAAASYQGFSDWVKPMIPEVESFAKAIQATDTFVKESIVTIKYWTETIKGHGARISELESVTDVESAAPPDLGPPAAATSNKGPNNNYGYPMGPS